MSVIYELLQIAGIVIASVVSVTFIGAWLVYRWQVRQCARKGHDFSKGPSCRRCEAPQPVMSGKGGF